MVAKPEVVKGDDRSNVTLPVRKKEEPWTADEVAEQRVLLQSEVDRLRKAIEIAEEGLAGLMSEGADGAGRDPIDVGSSNFERDQEMSLTANSKEMLNQAELALRLFEEGGYGLCESCGEPIGKGRLQAFPRATMCVTCKQREERR